MAENRITVWVQHFKDRPHLVLQWIDPDTHARKSKSAKTADLGEAEQARADLEYELNHGHHKEASRMSWEKFRQAFEAEYLSGRREKTRALYSEVFDLFEARSRPTALRSINERTISGFLGEMRRKKVKSQQGYAPQSCKVYLQFLHTALKWAADQKLIPACPKFPSVKVPKKRPQPVPLESFERLLAKAPDQQTRTYMLCGWLAGLRLSEAYELEWEESAKFPWIDLGRSRIILPADFAKAVEDQWVAIDPELRKAIEALPRRGRKVFHFPGPDGERISACGLGQRVIILAKRAGVKLSMHTLRKGFGCRYAGKVPAQVLQKLMRHSNIRTTMDYYVNVDQAAEEAILGVQRNSSRNNGPETGTGANAADGRKSVVE